MCALKRYPRASAPTGDASASTKSATAATKNARRARDGAREAPARSAASADDAEHERERIRLPRVEQEARWSSSQAPQVDDREDDDPDHVDEVPVEADVRGARGELRLEVAREREDRRPRSATSPTRDVQPVKAGEREERRREEVAVRRVSPRWKSSTYSLPARPGRRRRGRS